MLYTHKDLILRKVDKYDLDELHELKEESWNSTHNITFTSETSQEQWLKNLDAETHSPRNLVLIGIQELAHKSQLTGTNMTNTNKIGVFKILNIDWQNRKAEVGWDVFKFFRKKGFGKQIVEAGVSFCFDILNLRRVDAQILASNEASIRCAKHAGFKQTGLQEEAIYKNGTYVDNLLFGARNAKTS